MRILVSTSTFPIALDDGTPRFIYDLSESLAAHAEVTVLAPGSHDVPPRSKLGSLDVRRFNYFWPRRLQKLTPGGAQGMVEKMRTSWIARAQIGFFMLRQAWTTRRLARTLDADVVNAHWIVPQGLTAAWALGKKRKAKLVIHIHAADVYLLRRIPFGRAIARYIVKRTDAILSAGSHVRDCLDELLGFPSNAQLQPMGVHAELFGRALETTTTKQHYNEEFPEGYILFIGRFVEKKGTIYLLRALAKIRQQHPGLGLVLVGSGTGETMLKQEVEQLGLADAVRFAGRKSHDEIARLLHNCRVVSIPSIIDSRGETEGMPTVIVEAMSAGVRIVGSEVDGIPDIIRHKQNGWLCRQKDPDDLAEKMLMALEDPTPSPVTQSAIETSKRYTWPQIAENYMTRLHHLTSGSDTDAT